MVTCPHCGSTRVYPSRLSSPLERVLSYFTRKRPQRCHECHWRAWDRRGWDQLVKRDDLERPPGGRVERALSTDELDDLDPSPPTNTRASSGRPSPEG